MTARKPLVLVGGDLSQLPVGDTLDFAGQLAFPVAQNASSDANTLDDYEEGTFTPALAFGGAAVGMTFNAGSTTGDYTKIGRLVTFRLRVILTAKGSSTGTANITGLPFAAASGAPTAVSIVMLNMTGLNAPAAWIGSGASAIIPWNFNGTTSSQMTDAHFTNTSIVAVGGQYIV